ncbi:RHS repeat-associated core domain-containing protein, partial [Streptomyces sp. NPDC001107]
ALRVAPSSGTGNGTLTWLMSDPQNSSQLTIATDTGTATRRRYLPFGAQRGSTSLPTSTDRGFLGKTEDDSTGLDILGARAYDPALGRFLTTDPLSTPYNPQGLNAYTYSLNNPTNLSDPSGLESCGLKHYCSGSNGTYGDYHAENDPGSKKYKGSSHYCDTHKCSGGSSSGTHDSSGTVEKLNNPKLPTAPLSAAGAAAAGASLYREAMKAVAGYLAKNSWAYSRFTLVLSEVYVKTVDGIVPRIVGFVSKGGLDKKLLDLLTEMEVTVYKAAPDSGKGHAEDAAADFREDTVRQVENLGGEITEVENAYSTNRACSEACGRGLTKFVAKPGVVIKQGDQGYVMGKVMDEETINDLRDAHGAGRAIDVITRGLEAGFLSEGAGMEDEEK